MSAWTDGPLAGYDVESTGIDVESDRVVTATFVTVQPGEQPQATEWLIAPDIAIPEAATAIHGISDEYARAHGRPAGDALPEVFAALTSWWSEGLPVIMFNARYDTTITDRELARHCGLGFDDPRPIIDPWVIDKGMDRRKGTRKLAPTGEHHKAPLVGDAHDATVDAIGAVRLAWRLGKVYPSLGGLDLDRLHDEQARKAGEQQASYERYRCDQLAREGKWDEAEALRLPREWPLIPRQAQGVAA